jgi:2-deoxy-D-gluconate 3-dehydrogenase
MASMFSLEGSTALITGATRGIGQAVAIGLAEAGADIILIQVRRTLSQAGSESEQCEKMLSRN